MVSLHNVYTQICNSHKLGSRIIETRLSNLISKYPTNFKTGNDSRQEIHIPVASFGEF